MKHTLWIRCLAVLLTAILLIFSLTACNPEETAEENAEVRGMTVLMLDSILNDDYDTARGLMQASADDANFQKFYEGARKLLDGEETYTLTVIGLRYNLTDEVSRYTVVYRLETGMGKEYDVTVGTSSDMEGLYGFHLTHAGAGEAIYTGTLTTMQQATPLQWAMLIIGFATLVFLIAMLVDCCRQKILKKWLWILVIIFGSVAVLLTFKEGSVDFDINFLNLLSYTALLIYQVPANVVQLRLFLPIGAIVYLVFRKRLLAEGRRQAAMAGEVVPDQSVKSAEIRMDNEAVADAETTETAETAQSEDSGK